MTDTIPRSFVRLLRGRRGAPRYNEVVAEREGRVLGAKRNAQRLGLQTPEKPAVGEASTTAIAEHVLRATFRTGITNPGVL